MIFVSNDRSREDQQAFYAAMHADWLCVEFAPALQDLGDAFGVEHLPELVVVDRTPRSTHQGDHTEGSCS